MLSSKLLDIWSQFDKKQHRQFGEFLASPFFNKNKDLIAIHKYVKAYGPAFNSEKALAKELVFQKALKKPFDAKKMGYIMSDLVKLSERFLVAIHVNENDQRSYFDLLNTYHQFKLEKNFNSIYKEAQKKLDAQPLRDSEFYYWNYMREHSNNAFFNQKHRHVANTSLQVAIDHLDIYYLSQKLSYSCELLNQQKVLSTSYRVELMEYLIPYVDEHLNTLPACVTIYYFIYKTLVESEEVEHFQKLKELLLKHAVEFGASESRSMYMYAINYAIRRINKGETIYQEDLFNFYVQLLDKNIIYDKGMLSPWTYKNIVSIALRNEKFDWAANFIEEKKERLEEPFKTNAYIYNLAYLKFKQRDFGKALQLLQEVEFTDLYYSLDTKSLLVKIYYELDEVELLNAHVHAFKIYLSRNKLLSDAHKEIYFNLSDFTRRLKKILHQDKLGLKELKNKIEQTKRIADLSWLRQKVQEAEA